MHIVAGMPHAEPTALQRCTRLHEEVCVFAPPLFIISSFSSSHTFSSWKFLVEFLVWICLLWLFYFFSRSRLSWGQITGCYHCFRLPVCVVGAGDGPSVLQGPSCHLYPVAILLVTSHLLVLWLILSLVLLVAQYQ